MIMWSNTWSSTWCNTWPTNIIFLEANKPYLYYFQNLSSLTYHPHSKISINPTFVARRGHHQLVNQHSETFTNIAIILIDDIYKEFYKFWSSCPAWASAHSKTLSQTIRAWSSLSLAYKLIVVPTPFQSGVWVRKALGYPKGREWSGKKMAGWTQSKNLFLGC